MTERGLGAAVLKLNHALDSLVPIFFFLYRLIQPRYQFKMDRRVLSPVQLAAITRIYGEHGAEILELLRKNPCKTIPIILERLRQKDVEWRVVSDEAFLLLILGRKTTIGRTFL